MPPVLLFGPFGAVWFALLLVLLSGLVQPSAISGDRPSYREPWRPRFHFTPPRHWMNDPNGLVYAAGEYHLFYQFNPFGDRWGHMSWGHAVSRDLVRWRHLPVALPEADGVMMFSGSAVVDRRNTSGLGSPTRPPLVAIYTGHREGRQDQRLAYSRDRGRTWVQLPENPVLDLGLADFRDPKVRWHEPTGKWVMTVALSTEKKVHFYVSPDLRHWAYAGEFGPAGSTEGLWECPDLFPLEIQGGGTRWVLVVNINPGGPAGGSGCQYFTGEFDGARFTADPIRSEGGTLWADYGADFYAAVTWSDIPARDGRRLWLGWMSNWQYAQEVPTAPWRSAMTIPRELGLRRTSQGLRLTQTPVRELQALRGKTHRFGGGTLEAANAWLDRHPAPGEVVELWVDFELGAEVRAGDPSTESGLRRIGQAGESTVIRCRPGSRRLELDRTLSGRTDFHPRFPAVHGAPLRMEDGHLRLRVLVDTGSFEVFAEGGEVVLTDLVFPTAGSSRWELFGAGRIRSLEWRVLHAAFR